VLCNVPSMAPNDKHENNHENNHQQEHHQSSALLYLPPELHHQILSSLPYPDQLALRLTHPYFRSLQSQSESESQFLRSSSSSSWSSPTTLARIDWIISRADAGLPIPQRGPGISFSFSFSFATDALFVANAEIKTILRRRRRHDECVECRGARRRVVERLGEREGRRYCFVTGRGCPRLAEGAFVLEREREREIKKQVCLFVFLLLCSPVLYCTLLYFPVQQ